MEAIADAWRQELAPDGVQVALVEPGPLATPIWSKAAHSLDSLPKNERYEDRVEALRERLRKMGKQSPGPEQAVELIMRALTAARPRTRYAGGVAATVVPKVRRLVPDRVFDRVAQHLTGLNGLNGLTSRPCPAGRTVWVGVAWGTGMASAPSLAVVLVRESPCCVGETRFRRAESPSRSSRSGWTNCSGQV